MDIEILTQFFAWATLIHVALLVFMVLMITIFRKPVTALHAKMFSLNEDTIRNEYFRFIGQYKLFVIVFSLVPYVTLRLIFQG